LAPAEMNNDFVIFTGPVVGSQETFPQIGDRNDTEILEGPFIEF
jgi:hypothetical protein